MNADASAKKLRKKNAKKLREQRKRANARAKYGSKGRPAKVIVKRLDGTVIGTLRGRRIVPNPLLGELPPGLEPRAHDNYDRGS